MLSLALVVLGVALASAAENTNKLEAPEKQLAGHLLSHYYAPGRPVKKASDTIKVSFSLSLTNIIKTEKNSITIASWPGMRWNDPFLTWSPEQFDGLKQIALPATSIWRPDIANYNDVHHKLGDQLNGMLTADVLVMHTGDVIWIPRANFQSVCDGYDEEGQMNCEFIFGSWVHETSLVDLNFDQGIADFDLKFYKKSPFTDIVEHSAVRKEQKYDGVPGTYTSLVYKLVVRKAAGTCNGKNGKCDKY